MTQATSHIRVLTLFAILAAVLALVSLYRPTSSGPAEATHGSTPGQVDVVAVDAGITGNGGKTISAIEDCIAVNPNDTVVIDVIVDEVDAIDTIIGIDFIFNYDPAFVTVTNVQDSTGVLMSDDGSPIISFSSIPTSDSNDDPDSIPEGIDGSIKVAAADFGASEQNYGSGVIARLTLDMSSEVGVTDILALEPLLVDALNGTLIVNETPGAQIASGVPCPASIPKTDIQVTDVQVSAPSSVPLGASFDVTADALITNLGPDGPASVNASATLSVPSDCSIASPNPVNVSGISLGASEGVRAPAPAATWSVSCSAPSDHILSVLVSATPDPGVSIDNSLGNNQASGQKTNAITSSTDLKITSFSIAVPPDTLAGKPFDVFGSATLHNNGPLSPAVSFVTFNLTAPQGCTISPYGQVKGGEFTMQASVNTVLNQNNIRWRVRCDQPGTHNFAASGFIETAQLHVTETNGSNDTWNAGTSTTTKIGACQEDTNPETNPFQNLGPTLLGILLQLTADGSAVPEDSQVPLDCYLDLLLDDNGGGPVDDCESALIEQIPCDIRIDVGVDLMGGTPANTPGTTLNPIAVSFLPSSFTLANDAAVPNGAVAGEAAFYIRSDAGLSPNGGECTTDVQFEPRVGVEGGVRPNVPESNLDSALLDPHVWPNDLNAEIALVESSFDVNPLVTELTLWSRTIIPLEIVGVLDLPLNIIIWRIDDPTLQSVTQARWIMLAFPGDAVNPDPPGSIGGNPDADDPEDGSVLIYCTPFSETITLYGLTDGVVRNRCTSAGDQVAWALMDPNAVHFTGDDGTRSNSSPCSVDADNDGLTSTEETYYGTDPANADSDADGHQDGADNCPANSNPDQQNFDGDRMGDICDPDMDGDGADNVNDLCAATPTNQPADSNGCSQAQVDSDADRVCNPGAPSGGPAPNTCSGSDVCPNTQAGHSVATNGCAQYEVDTDADGACNAGAPESPPICTGVDNCPGVANPDQSDVDGDGYGDACDGCPAVANPWAVPANDDDCDGYTTAAELLIGTNATIACGFSQPDGYSENWPPDLVANNSINISDVVALRPAFGDTDPLPRLDLVPNNVINIADVVSLKPFFGESCTP